MSQLGEIWSPCTTETGKSLTTVAWNEKHFVCFGSDSNGGIGLTSINAKTWTSIPRAPNPYINALIASGDRLIAAASGGQIMVTKNLEFWASLDIPRRPRLSAVISAGGLVLTGGDDGRLYGSNDNGDSWGYIGFVPIGIQSMAYSGSMIVVVRDAIQFSPNGQQWLSASVPGTAFNRLCSVCWGRDKFVAVGNDGQIATSTNGSKWTSQNSGVTAYLNHVAWGQNQFVAVGNKGVILTSPDGISWTNRQTNTTHNLNASIHAAQRWVTVGDEGTILVSQ